MTTPSTVTRRARAAWVAALTALVVGAGCGGNGGVETASMRSAVRESVSGGADPGGGAPGAPDEGSAGSTTTPGGGSGDPGDSGQGGSGRPHREDVAEFCRLLRTPPAESADGDVAAVLDWMGSLRDVAPTEVVEDLDVLVAMVDALARLEENDPEAFGTIFETLMDPRVATASEYLTKAAMEHCSLEADDFEGFGSELDDLDGLFRS